MFEEVNQAVESGVFPLTDDESVVEDTVGHQKLDVLESAGHAFGGQKDFQKKADEFKAPPDPSSECDEDSMFYEVAETGSSAQVRSNNVEVNFYNCSMEVLKAPDVAASSKTAPDLVPASSGGPDIAAHTTRNDSGSRGRPPEVVRDAEAELDFDIDNLDLNDDDDEDNGVIYRPQRS